MRIKRFAVLAMIAVFVAVDTGGVVAAAPTFTIVHGPQLEARVVLDNTESFAFDFGTILEESPSGLEARPFLTFSFFWYDPYISPSWREFLDAGGDPHTVDPLEGNQEARLYFGTEAAPPIFAYQNKNPGGWPVRSSEFVRRLGPHPLAILAAHGVPLSLTDPFGQARVEDDPPRVGSPNGPILPIQLPNAGGGGLADTRSVGPTDPSRSTPWAPLLAGAAAAAVVAGVGVAVRHRR